MPCVSIVSDPKSKNNHSEKSKRLHMKSFNKIIEGLRKKNLVAILLFADFFKSFNSIK